MTTSSKNITRLSTLTALVAATLLGAAGCNGDEIIEGSATDGTTGDTDTTTSDTADPTTTSNNTTDGTTGDTDTTTGGDTTSQDPYCGDGVVDDGEECDDGNEDNDDACLNTCIMASCGDGYTQEGVEECDDGSEESWTCNEQCQLFCGDGAVNNGEECDDGNVESGDGCDYLCKHEVPHCGNGVVNEEEGEKCDDGNIKDGDGCESNCQVSQPGVCGDDVVDWNEPCDGGVGCEDDCTPTLLNMCDIPIDYSCDAYDENPTVANALGLGCGVIGNVIMPAGMASVVCPDESACHIATGFGQFKPWEGDTFVVLSTGESTPPDLEGVIYEGPSSQGGNGSNGNPDGVDGSDMWGEGVEMNDLARLRLTLSTPKDAVGYSFRFAVGFSAWPNINTVFDDGLGFWQTSESYTGPVGELLSATTLSTHFSSMDNPSCENNAGTDGPGYSCEESKLAGSGFEGDAMTTDLRVNGSTGPEGESFTVEAFLFDKGDDAEASVAVFDGVKYLCDKCIPEDAPACQGVNPAVNCCGIPFPQATAS